MVVRSGTSVADALVRANSFGKGGAINDRGGSRCSVVGQQPGFKRNGIEQIKVSR